MKSKLLITLAALTLILGIGCAHAVGGAGWTGGHGAMMGGHGAFTAPGSATHDSGSMSGPQNEKGQQGMTRDSEPPSGQRQGLTGHDHGVSSTDEAKGDRQFYQPHGGPPYCP